MNILIFEKTKSKCGAPFGIFFIKYISEGLIRKELKILLNNLLFN